VNPWLILAALLLAMGVGAGGYIKGGADNEARHVATALKQAVRDADATRALAAAEQKARLLARELEDLAYADPVAVPECLSVDRVRRLNTP
jgi:hypothetical protein